jgi:hypothetical protein
MKTSLRAVVLVAAVLIASTCRADGLVGKTVPPYPAGLQSLSGSCLGDPAQGEDVCALTIATLNDASGAVVGIFAGAAAGHDADGGAFWKVLAELPVPGVASGYEVQIGTCRRDGADDPLVVAVARLDPNSEYSADISWAARFDRERATFAEIKTAGVDCLFPGS